MELYDSIKSLLAKVTIPASSSVAGKQIVHLGIPKPLMISLIIRDKQYIIPRGDTVLEAGDVLYVLSENSTQLEEMKRCLDVECIHEGEYIPESEIITKKTDI
jgi:NhaP-type Na+/H+ and K+/H+ antiporter